MKSIWRRRCFCLEWGLDGIGRDRPRLYPTERLKRNARTPSYIASNTALPRPTVLRSSTLRPWMKDRPTLRASPHQALRTTWKGSDIINVCVSMEHTITCKCACWRILRFSNKNRQVWVVLFDGRVVCLDELPAPSRYSSISEIKAQYFHSSSDAGQCLVRKGMVC